MLMLTNSTGQVKGAGDPACFTRFEDTGVINRPSLPENVRLETS